VAKVIKIKIVSNQRKRKRSDNEIIKILAAAESDRYVGNKNWKESHTTQQKGLHIK